MYIPDYFRQKNFETIRKLISENPFGVLLVPQENEVLTTLLPMINEIENGKLCIYGHMARANESWKIASGNKVTLLFTGPHHYISPRWYVSRETVPTWNYIAVRISGAFSILDESGALDILSKLGNTFDRAWSGENHGKEEYYLAMLEEIVAFRVDAASVDASWKLSQNHSEEDRSRIIRELEDIGSDDARKIAGIMRDDLHSKR